MPPPKLNFELSDEKLVADGESVRRYEMLGDILRPISTCAKAAGASASAATVRSAFFIK